MTRILILTLYHVFFLQQNKVLLCQQLIKPQMNNEHMQIAWQFLTEATAKKQAFLVRNNYCKTLENP